MRVCRHKADSWNGVIATSLVKKLPFKLVRVANESTIIHQSQMEKTKQAQVTQAANYITGRREEEIYMYAGGRRRISLKLSTNYHTTTTSPIVDFNQLKLM